jgi:hypothetical protein
MLDAHLMLLTVDQLTMALFNPKLKLAATYNVGSIRATATAIVRAESGLVILLSLKFSQPKINSKVISQTKNNWNVLPFHMASKELESKKYSHKRGTINAIKGNNGANMLGFFLILESRFSIYRYQSTYSILQLTFYFKKNLPKSILLPEKFTEQKNIQRAVQKTADFIS